MEDLLSNYVCPLPKPTAISNFDFRLLKNFSAVILIESSMRSFTRDKLAKVSSIVPLRQLGTHGSLSAISVWRLSNSESVAFLVAVFCNVRRGAGD